MNKGDKLAMLKERAENAEKATVSRTRYGYQINGEFYRRVTTFLGGIPKPWLGSWAAKMVAEFAVQHRDSWMELPKTDAIKLLKGAPRSKRDDAGDRGTAVHNTIEAIVRGDGIPEGLTEDELDCSMAAKAFLDDRGSTILASELTVFSPKYGYAGTLDLWDLHDGLLWVLDYKTSTGIYAEHAVQQAAYRNAEFAIVNKVSTGDEKWSGKIIPWGPEMVDRMGIVHVKADGAMLYPIRYTERLWTVFRAAAHVKMWQLDTDSFAGKTPREVIYGDPIQVVKTEKEQTV